MVNQGNISKTFGNVIVVEDIDMNSPQCEYYPVCNLAGTSLKCSYRKSGLDNCFEPTLEHQKNMKKHQQYCPGCSEDI